MSRRMSSCRVLEAEGWVTVRLLKKDAATRISRLPTVENGVFAVVDGFPCFLTSKAGAYSFDLGFLTAAQVTGTRRRAEISYPAAALAVLKLRFDEHLFALQNADRMEEGEGYTLYPQSNRFELLWERSAQASAAKKQAARRPPIEPVITTAHASVVSTLEGAGRCVCFTPCSLKARAPSTSRCRPGRRSRRCF